MRKASLAILSLFLAPAAFGQDAVLSKTFIDGPAVPGGLVTLQFTINNELDSTALVALSFTDDLATMLPGAVAVGPTQFNICATGSSIGGTSFLTFGGGSLLPGASCTFAVTLQIPEGASPGDYINTTSRLNGVLSPPGPMPALNEAPATAILRVVDEGDEDPLAAMVGWANDAYGTTVVDESSTRSRLKPSTWQVELDELLQAANANGCTTTTAIQDYAGGRFDRGFLLGSGTLGVVTGSLGANRTFTGSLGGVSDFGSVFSSQVNAGHLVADLSTGDFVAGKWFRVSGRRGVFWTVSGTCDGPDTAAEALEPWFPGSLAGWL